MFYDTQTQHQIVPAKGFVRRRQKVGLHHVHLHALLSGAATGKVAA
jgi:hypothetical protein